MFRHLFMILAVCIIILYSQTVLLPGLDPDTRAIITRQFAVGLSVAASLGCILAPKDDIGDVKRAKAHQEHRWHALEVEEMVRGP